MTMLLSGCVLCAMRSPVAPVRDLIRTVRLLRSLGHHSMEQLPRYSTYHTHTSSRLLCTNSRKCQLVANHCGKKHSVDNRLCIRSDRYMYTERVAKAPNCLSYRSVFKFGCDNRPNLLLNSDTGLQHSIINICDRLRTQLRFYSTKEPNSFSATDDKKINADKQTITDSSHGRILTVPNVLTMLRMVMAPALGFLVLEEAYPLACGVFVVAGLTDLLDGFIARNFKNQTSALGSFIDPLADKLLISILFVSLTAVNLLPVALTALVLVRDMCLMSAGFYIRYISLDPRPKSLQEYFDITNPSARLQPTFLSKVNTAVQLSVVAFTLAAPVFGYVEHPALQALWYLTAATTLGSGVGYIFAKNTFKLLQQSRKST